MRHALTAALALFTVSAAHAAITISSSTAAYFLDTNIYDIDGIRETTPRSEELISLLTSPTTSRTRDLSANVPAGTVTSTLTGSDQLTITENSFTMNFTGEAHTQANWNLANEAALDFQADSNHRTITHFATDSQLSVSLAGTGSITGSETTTREGGGQQGGPDGPLPPYRIWLQLYTPDDFDSPIYQSLSEPGEIAALFTIDPGQYIFLISVESFIELDTLTTGTGSIFETSKLNFTANFTTIPAPAATLLFPLAAAFSTRRRR